MKIYQVCICTLCGDQADWYTDKRGISAWICENPKHDWKFLKEDETQWIEVIPLWAVDEIWDRIKRLEK